MNWPFDSKNVKKMNEAAYSKVANYMQCHAAEFMTVLRSESSKHLQWSCH